MFGVVVLTSTAPSERSVADGRSSPSSGIGGGVEPRRARPSAGTGGGVEGARVRGASSASRAGGIATDGVTTGTGPDARGIGGFAPTVGTFIGGRGGTTTTGRIAGIGGGGGALGRIGGIFGGGGIATGGGVSSWTSSMSIGTD